jgi:hypothetical protein
MKCVNNTTANTLKKIFTKSTKSIYIYIKQILRPIMHEISLIKILC